MVATFRPGQCHGGAVMLLFRLGDFFLRLDCDILGWWGEILEGKNRELREDPVHREHFIFLFLVDVSIFYWWAKIPSFLPRPDISHSKKKKNKYVINRFYPNSNVYYAKITPK